jgi:two-component system, chemotaxis family, protein-glutamate methylesterase/glutaminase
LTSTGPGRRRVLICEDSRTYAEALRRALEHAGEIEVVGVFPTAEEAIAALPQLRPHLVTMDLELPGMSGLEAVERIMGMTPVPMLVLSAHVGPRSGSAAAALAAGALDALHKEALDLRQPDGESAAALRRRVKILCGVRVIRHPRARLAAHLHDGVRQTRAASVIGICASTGGPHALATILQALPATFAIPIMVVQHITPGFTEGLVRWLADSIPLPVRMAEHGVKLEPGVWIAPEEVDLVLERSDRLALAHSDGPALHRPSADALLTSLAESAERNAVAVVLTGMGRDGGVGVQAVRAAGGLTIAQDEQTSTVFGMPKAAFESGAELVLPLHEIAGQLMQLLPLRTP